MAYTSGQFILSSQNFSGNIELRATCESSGAGRISFLLLASHGSNGVNGYLVKYSAVSGEYPAQILRVDNGTATSIGTYSVGTNASQLSGPQQISCWYHSANQSFAVYFNGVLAVVANDSTYAPALEVGYGCEDVSGYISNFSLGGHQAIHISNQDPNGKALIDFSQTSHLNKTQDNVPDGPTYARTKGTELTNGGVNRLNDGTTIRTAGDVGAAIASGGNLISTNPIAGRTEGIGTTVGQLDSGGILLAGGADFSRSYTNKTLDYINQGTTYGSVKQTELASNTVKQLNDGTNVRTAGDVSAVVKSGGHIQSTAIVDGRTEGISTTVGNIDSGGIVLAAGVDMSRSYTNKNQDNIPEGTLYARTPGSTRGGSMQPVGKVPGFAVVSNPDFYGGSLTNYSVYDNNSTGYVTLAVVSNSAAPSGFGNVLRINTSASGTTPGLGGFYYGLQLDSGSVTTDTYHQGDEYIIDLVANIPSGYTLNFTSNSLGTGGSYTWLSSTNGNNNFQHYVLKVAVGASPSNNAFPFFYLSGGAAPVTWFVAQLTITDIDQTARPGVLSVDPNQRAIIDFTQSGHLSKTLDYIDQGSTYGSVKQTELASNTVKQLNDGTIVRTAGDVGAAILSGGHFISTNPIDGRTEGIGTTVTHLNSSGQFDSPDNIAAPTGSTYGIVKVTELASNTVKQLNDGTNVRTAGDVSAVVKSGGHIQSTAVVDGRTEGLGTTVQYLDAGGQVLALGLDFSRTYINKTQDYIDQGTTYGSVKQTELASNTVKQLNDGTTIRTAGDVGAAIASGGNLIAANPIVGRTEGIGTTVAHLNSSGLLDNADSINADGSTYGRVKLTGLNSGFAVKTGSSGGYNIKGVGDTQTLSFDNEVADGTTYKRLQGVASDNVGLTLGYSGSTQMTIAQNGLISISNGGHQVKRTLHTQPYSTTNTGTTANGDTVYLNSTAPNLVKDNGSALPTFSAAPTIALQSNNMSTPPMQLYATNITTTSFVVNAYSSGTTQSIPNSDASPGTTSYEISSGTTYTITPDSTYDITSLTATGLVNSSRDVDSYGNPLYHGSVTFNYTITYGSTPTSVSGSFSVSWVSTGATFGGSYTESVPASHGNTGTVELSWGSAPTGVASLTGQWSGQETNNATPITSGVDFTAIITEEWA